MVEGEGVERERDTDRRVREGDWLTALTFVRALQNCEI
jgi:hypothetical protein